MSSTPKATITISTRLGDIIGSNTGSTIRATGVRYASAKRFAAPKPVQPWIVPLDATKPGRACPQRPSRLDWVTGAVTSMLEQSEDCLTVTVTAPSPVATDAPVMVFFHGGAYVSGSGECPAYDPTTLVEEQAVVVVTVTYRLGLLGNLAIERRARQISASWIRSLRCSGYRTTLRRSEATRGM